MLSLAEMCCEVLLTADARDKAEAARRLAAGWRTGRLEAVGACAPPDHPARPERPVLRPPRDMARRGKGHGRSARIALLHAIAHIELNAVDLACDLIARFAGDATLPRSFFDDWVGVADEEGKHFLLLAGRLETFGATYGDLPAHDGLWQAAQATAHDLLVRLAIVPLVFEARGLDVTPPMIANLERAGDPDSAGVLRVIYEDEIGHVALGHRWFEHVAAQRGLAPVETWHALVRAHYAGALKPPFNDEARSRAGLSPAYYAPLAATT